MWRPRNRPDRCCATAETDNRIRTGEAFLPQTLPDAVGHFDGLAGFSIGNDDVVHVITGLAQQRARAVGMPLHRLGVNQCHFGRLVPQHLRKLAHHTFAYAHIVWFDGGSGDVDDTLIDHFHQLSRGHLRGLSVGAHLHIGHASEHRVAFLVQLLPTLVASPLSIGRPPPRLARSMLPSDRPSNTRPCRRRRCIRRAPAGWTGSLERPRPRRRCRRNPPACQAQRRFPAYGTPVRRTFRNIRESSFPHHVRSRCRRRRTAVASSAPLPCRRGSCPRPSCR